MSRKTYFVDVILPLAIPNLYSYRVPFELNDYIKIGQRVVVPLGRGKQYTAIVAKIHEEVPAYSTKYIMYILDQFPIVTSTQLKFWKWIADYYMCHIGEVMIAALPSSLKLASETNVLLNDDFSSHQNLSEDEFLIVEALELREVLSLKEIGEILNKKTVYPVIKRMIDKGIVSVEEELKERYKPKTDKFVHLNPSIETEEDLENIINSLSRAKKQQEVVLAYLHLSNHFENPQIVRKSELIDKANASSSILRALYDKEILIEEEIEVGRLEKHEDDLIKAKSLSEGQQKAHDEILNIFKEKDICLLHGVTGSGKTEIYVSLIKKVIAEGKKVLYLLPEIALTTQIISRLKKIFGDQIAVYHSKFSSNERVEIWNETLNKNSSFSVLLGARSAIFLPIENIGLIVVDEEHENSFKQYDPAPRYNARDSAMVLAKMHNAKVLFGSATPAMESMWAAEQDKYGLVTLNKRFGDVQLPEVQCADIKDAKRKKKMFGIFSEYLLENIKEALDNKEQVILFQNRRGYSPKWSCEVCNWTPMCTRCDVSLTYHKFSHKLSCHYCGYSLTPPNKCENCGSTELKMVGFGTEKIEEELSLHLNRKVNIQRMDLDTTRSKYAYQNIISDFENRQIDVLVGTQMVTKGLDFDNVSLVGILNADDMLYYPDFRAFERAYQLMTQVSGRAGRSKKRGKVIIQTHNPDHWIIQRVMQNDYDGMYKQELYERKTYLYPPFFKIIKLTIRHKDKDFVDKASDHLAKVLGAKFGNRLLGPEYPVIPRIKNYYNKIITLKFERDVSMKKIKEFIREQLNDFAQSDYKSVRVKIDVDPM